MPPDALITLDRLVVRLGGIEVLRGVSLGVRPREIVTLVGPNGAGKSTLVRAALGLTPIASGRIVRRPSLRIGYMPQHMTIEPTMPLTVRRFLALSRPVARARAEAVLAECGVADAMERPVAALSGGQWRRVQLARALVGEPDLLVLDEPMQGIDISGQRELYALVGALRARRGIGVLMVSHDLHLVMASTDHVVCLNGHVCCEGHPESVTQHPEFLALFGPQDADAFALYRHAHDHEHDAEGRVVPRGGHAHDSGHDHGHPHDHAHHG
jgi:zinc transport system ATP-binding protein